MENDSTIFKSQLNINDHQIFNKFCTFTIALNDPQNIYKNSKQVTGTLTLIPKIPILNIPITVAILGESHCTLFQENINSQNILVKDSFSGPKSFRLYETQEDLVEKKNQVEKCLQSSEFLSQAYSQTTKNLIQKENKEIFLEGKQLLFHKSKPTENSPQKDFQQKIKVLLPNEKYDYDFSFFLPTNVPISVNSKIFPGVQLFVGYKIQASFQVDEKFLLCQESSKANYLKSGKNVSVFTEFEIQRVIEQKNDQNLANRLTFKYFNSQGQIQNNESSLTSCLTKCFCPQLWRQKYCYDLYHCELLTSIDELDLRILHLTARIFLEPDKDRIDVRKVKRGKMYMTNKKQDPQDSDERPRNKNQLTNSKIMPEKETNLIKINQVKAVFFGQIVGIKKLQIFEKILQLNRQNYDAVEGELILELPDTYFSEKNELFEIRYWFEIEPILQTSSDEKQGKQSEKISETKNEETNEFDLTFSKLNSKRNSESENSKEKKMVNQKQNKKQKPKGNSSSSKFRIQTVSSQQNFITL